jgi:hypothetical protein
VHSIPIDPPPRTELVTVCFTNKGMRRVALYGSNDRTRSRLFVTANGHRDGVAPQIAFYEAKPVSIADRASSLATRVVAFHAFLGHTWMAWLLAALVLAGVPVAIGAALWRAMDEE